MLIQTKELTKLYGSVIGVNDLTIELTPGVHGMLGPNGAGKSTLLKLVTGQLRPTVGEIKVLGQKPWNNPDLFRRIGFCPEQDSFYDYLSGLEFVSILAGFSGLDSIAARKCAEEVLDRCGASSFMHRKIATYSKGMRQRTKVAQALLGDPEFLILDEPLTAMDPIGRNEMTELFKQLGKAGKSILISSHVLHEVEAITDQFLLIYGGRIPASGNIREIRDLMDEFPHHITVNCDNPRQLAERMWKELPVSGLQLDNGNNLSVMTQSPREFFDGIAKLASEDDVTIYEMVSEDANLQSIFNYLVKGD